MKDKAKAWGMVLLLALIAFMIGVLPALVHKAAHH